MMARICEYIDAFVKSVICSTNLLPLISQANWEWVLLIFFLSAKAIVLDSDLRSFASVLFSFVKAALDSGFTSKCHTVRSAISIVKGLPLNWNQIQFHHSVCFILSLTFYCVYNCLYFAVMTIVLYLICTFITIHRPIL